MTTTIKGHGAARLRILDSTGHTELLVRPDEQASVDEARALFDQLRSQGHTAFEVGEDQESRQVDTYDPLADVVFVPQLAGGR